MKSILKNIIKGQDAKVYSEITAKLDQRMQIAKDMRKVALTATIFNKPSQSENVVAESISADVFVKGGNTKVVSSDVDTILGDIYDDSKLTKEMIKTKAYQAGESNPKGKNPYKKDTADYFLFDIAQQIELTRG